MSESDDRRNVMRWQDLMGDTHCMVVPLGAVRYWSVMAGDSGDERVIAIEIAGVEPIVTEVLADVAEDMDLFLCSINGISLDDETEEPEEIEADEPEAVDG